MADVLVVDDDEDMGETCAEVLRSQGHQVRLARNGREGLARVDEAQPDLILLDVEMPVLNGPDMAYEIMLADAGKEKIPICLASGARDLRSLAEKVGTPYFTAKPFSAKLLLAIVARALAERIPPTPRV